MVGLFKYLGGFIIELSLLLISNSTFSQNLICQLNDPARAPRERHTDFNHLDLLVEFEPQRSLVKGTVTHTFKWIRDGIDTLFLDAPGIIIKSVKREAENLKYDVNKEGLIIKYPEKSLTGKTEKLTITYEAKPRKGIYFIGWNDPNNISKKQIWTQGQGVDNRYWIPMYDEMNDKIKTRIRVLFDSSYKVLSNGKLVKKELQKDKRFLWEYVMDKPHAPYLIMLGIGEYEIKTQKSNTGIKLNLYMYKDRLNEFEPTYRYNKEIFDFLQNEINVTYPWPEYSQIPVQEFIYGAMENTSATVFGDFFIVDERAFSDRNYVAVNAHELAHQWFGDLVTARSARHLWLQEGFATFYNWLAEREIFGQDHYDWQRRQAQNSALEEGKKNTFPIAHSKSGPVRFYPKGAFVLHMLRHQTGDAHFRRAIQNYLKRHEFENVTSDDLLKAFHDELGIGLEWFWDQWIYGGGEPKITVKEQLLTGGIQLHIKQSQNGDGVSQTFRIPVTIELYFSDGSLQEHEIVVDSIEEKMFIPYPSNIKLKSVIFDAGNHILRDLTHEKSDEALEYQAKHARHMLDRYDALVSLREVKLPDKLNFLKEIYKKEKFWAVKGEAISQLMKEFGFDTEVQLLWKSSLKGPDNSLRKQAMQAFSENPIKEMESELLTVTELPDASYGLLTSVLRYLRKHNPEYAKVFIQKIKDLLHNPNASGLRIAVLEAQTELDPNNKQAYISEIINLSSPSYEFTTRAQAFQVLSGLSHFEAVSVNNGLQAYLSFNKRLSSAGESYLQEGFKKGKLSREQLEKSALLMEEFPEKDELIKRLIQKN